MNLADIPAEQRVRITGVDAGCGMAGRLTAMGILPGTPVRVVANAGRGPMIIRVRSSKVALGRNMACRVSVEPLP